MTALRLSRARSSGARPRPTTQALCSRRPAHSSRGRPQLAGLAQGELDEPPRQPYLSCEHGVEARSDGGQEPGSFGPEEHPDAARDLKSLAESEGPSLAFVDQNETDLALARERQDLRLALVERGAELGGRRCRRRGDFESGRWRREPGGGPPVPAAELVDDPRRHEHGSVERGQELEAAAGGERDDGSGVDDDRFRHRGRAGSRARGPRP